LSQKKQFFTNSLDDIFGLAIAIVFDVILLSGFSCSVFSL
jgi:hypothetical protein